MFGSADQPATTGVVVDVIRLLLPERFILDRFRVAARLPEAPLAVGSRLFAQSLREATGEVVLAVITQLPPGELPEIGECPQQPFRIEVAVEYDQVHVRRHDDERVDAQLLLAVAQGQAVRDDLAGRLADENGQPFHHGVGEEVDGSLGLDTVALHDRDCRRMADRRQEMGAARRGR
jgi:hypothetical protein